MKKIIAITQRVDYIDNYKETRETLDVRYLELIKKLDYSPLILSYTMDIEEYFKIFKVDGIFLSGGNDLYEWSNTKESRVRDIFEYKLIEYAIENSIPILGICRGMQVIANYFNSHFEKISNQVGINHLLKPNIKSKYFPILKEIKKVNSYHNYAVKSISSDLIVSAHNDDDIIKAIEHRELKIFGHMWHPERYKKFEDVQLSLIKDFFTDKRMEDSI